MKNHYEILSISPAATSEQIKVAYTNAVLKIQGQPNFASRFAEIQQAYDILSNPISRKQFDAELLSFYSGKFINVSGSGTKKQETKKDEPHLVFVFLKNLTKGVWAFCEGIWEGLIDFVKSETIGGIIATVFGLSIFGVLIFSGIKSCSNDNSADHKSTTANHDIKPSEFENKVSSVDKPEPITNIDLVTQDSINLVNQGYELRHLKNGAEPDCFNYTPRKSNIDNKLEVYVGYGTDVAVKLIDKETENCIRYFYVNSGSTYTIHGIPQGIYYLKLAYGTQWMMSNESGQCKGKFLRNAKYEIGEETLNYNFRYTSDGHSIPSYRLQLGISHNFDNSDNFRSTGINENEFNK